MPTANLSPRVYVTGDDFGLSPAVNAAIEAYHRAALCTRRADGRGKHVDDAVEIAREIPGCT
jgi:predicted glycoside hydrolase/deacetylase ChbG (UPF0249 family)